MSNIAWPQEYDAEMYSFLSERNILGIEIAPTRIFQERTYENRERTVTFKRELLEKYNLSVVSMQSVCFGRNERIFLSEVERITLMEYIKKAIDFAADLECPNLVFGSPKNRNINKDQEQLAIDYFTALGKYASEKNTVFALEPNPVIYGTNFINTTTEALDFVKKCNVDGLKVNLDLGTVIYNEEKLDMLENDMRWINHVHVSEPYLEPIRHRNLHKKLADVLKKNKYTNYISVEMKSGSELSKIKDTLYYLEDVFKS